MTGPDFRISIFQSAARRNLTNSFDLRAVSYTHLVVTNEIFSESAKDSEEMRKYKYIMGEINKELAKMADEVTEVVCGRPLRRKVKTAEDKTACGNTRRNEGNERQMKTCLLYTSRCV